MLEFVKADKALLQGQANINNQLKNDMEEFVGLQEQANASIIQYYSQAYYTSRKLTEIYFQEESQDFDSMII
jgi:hypothetical protein